MLYKLICLLVVLVAICTESEAAIIQQDSFEYTDSPLNHGWDQIGSNVSVGAWGKDGSRGLKVNYNGQGTAPYVVQKNLYSYRLREITVEFDFKIGENSTGGSKFLKFFGKPNSPQGYANTTFVIDYNSPVLYQIGYGAGAIENDSNNLIRYDGQQPTWLNGIDQQVNQLVGLGTININDGQWHHFKIFMRYNSNGLRDGVYKVWYDGRLWVHAENVVNRNDQNSLHFDFMRLGDYTSAQNTTAWNLYYDNVAVSTDGDIGGASPVDGVCGSAANSSFAALTSSSPGLCAIGPVDSFTSDSDSAEWVCLGDNGGDPAACSATISSAARDLGAVPEDAGAIAGDRGGNTTEDARAAAGDGSRDAGFGGGGEDSGVAAGGDSARKLASDGCSCSEGSGVAGGPAAVCLITVLLLSLRCSRRLRL